MTHPLVRPAARLLCVDAEGAVLLLGCVDPARPHLVHWVAPGGGVEDGESPRDAVVREAWEELGLVLDAPAEPVAETEDPFSWAGQPVLGQNSWFAVRTPRFTPVPRGMDAAELATTVGARWFTPDELRALPDGDAYEPTHTADLVEQQHRSLPTEPHRPTARVLVLAAGDRDGDGPGDGDRVLLVASAAVEGGTVWFAPGGGVEVGEDHREAAVRELAEELQLDVDVTDLAGPVWVRRHRLAGAVDLREVYFVLRVDRLAGVRDVAALDPADVDHERLAAEGVTDVRWWSLAQLSDLQVAGPGGDFVAPRGLADLLPPLLAHLRAGRLPDPAEVAV